MKDTSTLDEYLDIAHRIESVAEAENLPNQLCLQHNLMSKLTVSGLRPEARAEVLIIVAIEVVSMAKVEVRDDQEAAVTPLTVMTMHIRTVVKHIHPSHALLMA